MSADDPPPYFLITDLHRLTFHLTEGGTVYKADDTSMVGIWAWDRFVDLWADLKESVNFERLGNRARFLNFLYVFCREKNVPFPLEIEQEKEVVNN